MQKCAHLSFLRCKKKTDQGYRFRIKAIRNQVSNAEFWLRGLTFDRKDQKMGPPNQNPSSETPIKLYEKTNHNFYKQKLPYHKTRFSAKSEFEKSFWPWTISEHALSSCAYLSLHLTRISGEQKKKNVKSIFCSFLVMSHKLTGASCLGYRDRLLRLRRSAQIWPWWSIVRFYRD